MNDLVGAAVGQIICVTTGHYDTGKLYTIERVTPSGRVSCKGGDFNPDGTRRGGRGWPRSRAWLATAEDHARVNRHRLISKLSAFNGWHNLTDETLAGIWFACNPPQPDETKSKVSP